MNTGHVTFSELRNKTEITDITPEGFRLQTSQKEYFFSYTDFPELKEASLQELSNITTDFSGNLHWPDLNFSIEKESLDAPENYPLKYE